MKIAPAVAAAAVLIVLSLWIWDSTLDRVDPRAAAALEAGKRWRNSFDRVRAASTASRAKANSALRKAADAVSVADALRDSASNLDSLPAPQQTDTLATHWFTLFGLKGTEADSLRSALDQTGQALVVTMADRSRWQRLAEEGRAVNLQMDEALRAQQCRILFVKCPSRGAMLIGGVALGLVASEILRRRL